jgi:hypothetical protein
MKNVSEGWNWEGFEMMRKLEIVAENGGIRFEIVSRIKKSNSNMLATRWRLREFIWLKVVSSQVVVLF